MYVVRVIYDFSDLVHRYYIQLEQLVIKRDASWTLDYILISLDGEEPIELECEEDGSYLLSSLEDIVGCNITSLRYKNETTGNYRFVKVANGKFLPPKDGWGTRLYYVNRKPDACVAAAPSAMLTETQGVKEETFIKCKS